MPRKRMPRRFKKKAKVSDAVKSYVQKKIEKNIELKQAFLQFPAIAASATVGTRYLINAPNTTGAVLQQGLDWDERLGNEYLIKRVDWRGTIRITNLATSRYETFRVIMMYEKQPEGVSFAGGEFLIDVNSGRGIISDYNYKHKHRFVILSDRMYNLNDFSGNVVGLGTKKSLKLSHTFTKPIRTVCYNNPNPAVPLDGIAAVEKTAIYVVVFASANVTVESANTSCNYLDA